MTSSMRLFLLSLALMLATHAARAADLLTHPQPQPRFVGAGADRDPRYYVALRGGTTWAENTDFSTSAGTVKTEYANPRYLVSGAVGFHLDTLFGEATGLRAELEGGLLEAKVDSHVVGGTTFTGGAAKGSQTSTFVLGSLYYDFTPNSRFTPFIGAGAGIAEVDFNKYQAGGATAMDDTTTNWAYHATAGVSARLTPRWQMEAAYRLLSIPDAGPRNAESSRQEIDVTNHLLMIGARAHF
jgi:opacity protein-like surface antigen